jgi:2-polyprenyl-3-methyl-5-hydroxy-6-metoxy-1,4-benzoquinol methylase
MPDLSQRSTQTEVMDDLSLPAAEIDPVLAGLGKMNRLFGANHTIIKALKNFPVKNHGSVSDWGCGGGDTLIAIRQWADKNNLQLKLSGVDASDAAIHFAEQNSAGYDIQYFKTDVLGNELQPDQFDIVISGLFSHHFPDEEWAKLIRKMANCARRGVILTDLHRHRILYYAIILITHLFTRNKMVRIDGPLSVKRAFKRRELENLLARAGIVNYNLTWVWPFRWLLVIYK